MATLKLEIVTPEAKAYSEDVEMVTLPGIDGEMGIYPQHVPLMTQIVAGEVIARKGGRDAFLAVGEGFVEITGDHVSDLDRHLSTTCASHDSNRRRRSDRAERRT